MDVRDEPVRFVSQPEPSAEYADLKRWGLFDGIIFGPVRSRRFGRSLGVNPLPPNLKVCSFDCPYCECGRTELSMTEILALRFPDVELIKTLLEGILAMLAAEPPDTLTLTGNGEPTLHPRFGEVMKVVFASRARLAPGARIAVLTNGCFVSRPDVTEGLDLADVVMMKLDAGTPETLNQMNAPLVSWTPERVEEAAGLLGDVVIQSLFLEGAVSNTSDEEIAVWLERVARIKPKSVILYTLDRVPPAPGLRPVSPETLEAIGRKIEEKGITWEKA
jgi:wyosine [tRNA(Phe)-imidazoG37] synthetase (radical SAM superfamily)